MSNEPRNIDHIVVVGGDVMAPMVTAAIANELRGRDVRISLIDGRRTDPGSESLIPRSIAFHSHLGIEQPVLVRHSNATFKLGTEFTNWVSPDHSFVHAYGAYGAMLAQVPFHHYAIRQHISGKFDGFDDYSLAACAARHGKFDLPADQPGSIMSTFVYGLHVDTDRYANLFREYVRQANVDCIDGEAVDSVRGTDGRSVEAVILADDTRINGDFFVDCSGDRPLLIEGVFDSEFEDWSQYLPCDRSITVSVTDTLDANPLTRIVAKEMGWLQRTQTWDRGDYEFFYSSELLEVERALASLQRDVGQKTSGDAYLRKFVNGRRKSFWQDNCVAIGRAAGYAEPLEISNVYLAQNAAFHLMQLLDAWIEDPAASAEYDRIVGNECDNVRDFLCLFYACTKRDDSAFWKHCRSLDRPESLEHRLREFDRHGRFEWRGEETFPEDFWISALLGLGRWPESYDPLADVPDESYIGEQLERMRGLIKQAAGQMPEHRNFVRKYLSGQ